MRAVFLAGLFLCLPLSAQASWLIPNAQPHFSSHERYVTVRNYRTGPRVSVNRVRFPACARYGNLQCGCTASIIVFGRVLPGLPAVSEWLARFQRTSPHIGAAAIWPGRHVEVVSAVNNDGTVDTRGSVGWSHVSVARLIFVQP
jgi:hypothetical protein